MVHYLIQEVQGFGYWSKSYQEFKGIAFAYKMQPPSEFAFDEEFQKARRTSKHGVKIIKVYT